MPSGSKCKVGSQRMRRFSLFCRWRRSCLGLGLRSCCTGCCRRRDWCVAALGAWYVDVLDSLKFLLYFLEMVLPCDCQLYLLNPLPFELQFLLCSLDPAVAFAGLLQMNLALDYYLLPQVLNKLKFTLLSLLLFRHSWLMFSSNSCLMSRDLMSLLSFIVFAFSLSSALHFSYSCSLLSSSLS